MWREIQPTPEISFVCQYIKIMFFLHFCVSVSCACYNICVKQVKQQFTTCKKSSSKIVKLFYPPLPSCIHIFLSQFIVFILSYHKEKVGHCRECLPPTSVVRVRCLVFPGSPVFPFIKKRSQIPIWSSTQSRQFLTVLTTTSSWESLWITLWKQGWPLVCVLVVHSMLCFRCTFLIFT